VRPPPGGTERVKEPTTYKWRHQSPEAYADFGCYHRALGEALYPTSGSAVPVPSTESPPMSLCRAAGDGGANHIHVLPLCMIV